MSRPKKSGKRLTVRIDLDNYQRLNKIARESDDDDFGRVLNLVLRIVFTAPDTQLLRE